MRILVIDIGGTHIKLMGAGRGEKAKFSSGPKLTPAKMARQVKLVAKLWEYDAIAIGYPGVVLHGKPAEEPQHLGHGWVSFNFEQAFGKPVRMINDAAMQALGSYEGGRMLFLGLGTGLGSTLIVDEIVIPLELGHLRYSREWNLEEMLGRAGLKRLGRKKWEATVHRMAAALKISFVVDYVILGGGNAKKLVKFPEGSRPGNNANAFIGGRELWKRPGLDSKAHRHFWTIA